MNAAKSTFGGGPTPDYAEATADRRSRGGGWLALREPQPKLLRHYKETKSAVRWPASVALRRDRSRYNRARMLVHTDYLWFNTKKRQEFIRITDEVAAIVKTSGVSDGTALVSAMHITSSVYVNDWEDGLIDDFQVWLEKLAPSGLDYHHHRTGEDNADAHLKRTIMGHQVVLPITAGTLDLGPWEQVFYAEFDGRRKKRVVVKVMGI